MSELYRDADLDGALSSAAAETDRDIAASGASLRVGAAVLARISTRSFRRVPWMAIAATLLIAAGLGSVVDLALVNVADESAQGIVLLDPMIFGPTEVDVQ